MNAIKLLQLTSFIIAQQVEDLYKISWHFYKYTADFILLSSVIDSLARTTHNWHCIQFNRFTHNKGTRNVN